MIYHDFDLLIDRSGETLNAQVIDSTAGQAAAEFLLPFSRDKLENFLTGLRRITGASSQHEGKDLIAAKGFGGALFTAVFTGDNRTCFRSSLDEARRQNAGLRIRLRLADPTVVDLPWEYLYNPAVNRFLALSIQTPIARYVDAPERIQPIAVTPPLRLLVVTSSPTDYPALHVEVEWTRLNEALANLIAEGQIAIERLDRATFHALQHRLGRERYHILHFIAPAEFDQALHEGALIFEDEQQGGDAISSQTLGMMLREEATLGVVVLNGREGGRRSRAQPVAGLAHSLLQQAIPAVVTVPFDIEGGVASEFSHQLYGALADGYSIDAAVTEARKSIYAAGHEVQWGRPILYVRPSDGRIFDIEMCRPIAQHIPLMREFRTAELLRQQSLMQSLVAAARAAFAAGNHAEAIDLLRRQSSGSEVAAQALHELSVSASEPVKCSVFAPATTRAGDSLLVQVFAHFVEDEEKAKTLATTFDPTTTAKGASLLSRDVARGTELMFGLRVPGARVDEPHQSLLWRGMPESVQFGVTIPSDHPAASLIGTVTVSHGTVPIGHVKFVIKAVTGPAASGEPPAPAEQRWTRYRQAFISYANQDRAEVLKRVQMLDRVNIHFFQDVFSLEPGERWAKALYKNIDRSDVFFLFWSSAAKNSEWVLKEVRYAMERHAGDELAPPEIVPVMIEGPPPVPPPPELNDLHFDDRFLYFIAGAS